VAVEATHHHLVRAAEVSLLAQAIAVLPLAAAATLVPPAAATHHHQAVAATLAPQAVATHHHQAAAATPVPQAAAMRHLQAVEAILPMVVVIEVAAKPQGIAELLTIDHPLRAHE